MAELVSRVMLDAIEKTIVRQGSFFRDKFFQVVYAVPERGVLCVSDHVNAWLADSSLVIENPTVYPARVKVMIESEEDLSLPLGLYWQEKFVIAEVPAGGRVSVPLSI